MQDVHRIGLFAIPSRTRRCFPGSAVASGACLIAPGGDSVCEATTFVSGPGSRGQGRFCAAIESQRPEAGRGGLPGAGSCPAADWTLEWSLPGWLGDALHLPAGPTADLTLANVVGLAYVRLRDDLMDGEIPEGDRRTALMLATALYRTWLLAYTDMFASGSPFWAFFEQYMAQWAGATLHDDPSAARRFSEYDDLDLRRLGARGAPLKICAAGACLLAGRGERIPQLEAALDHLLIGAVLLDHARDWADDLAVGRYNALVAHASPLAQAAEHAEANRRAVLQELMVGKGARPYFAVLRQQLQTAIDGSRAAGVPALAEYVTWLRNQADAYGRQVARDARGRLHDLAGQVLSAEAAPPASVVA